MQAGLTLFMTTKRDSCRCTPKPNSAALASPLVQRILAEKQPPLNDHPSGTRILFNIDSFHPFFGRRGYFREAAPLRQSPTTTAPNALTEEEEFTVDPYSFTFLIKSSSTSTTEATNSQPSPPLMMNLQTAIIMLTM